MNSIYFYLIILFLTNCTTSEKKSDGIGYRLGDMIKSKDMRSGDGGKQFHLESYPESIASEYMRRTDDESNIEILEKIVIERTQGPDLIPASNSLILHLRIGDVIDQTPHMVKDFLARYILYSNGINYVKPLSYYESVYQKTISINPDISNVIILGGYHKVLKRKTKSQKYVEKIQQFFESKNMSVSLRINMDADDDFVFMSNASYFTPSGGGFSELIKKIVLKRNKIVVTPG